MPTNIFTRANHRDFFHSVLNISTDSDGLQAQRLTSKQFAYYDRTPTWAIRARCPAAVTIALQTDSPTLDVDLTIGPGARAYFGLELEVDGAFVHIVRKENVADGTRFTARLFDAADTPRKARTFRLYLPHSRTITLHNLTVADSAQVTPIAPPTFKLLCLGDSITQGMDAVSATATCVVQLARLLGADVLNQGIGGHVFDVDSLDPDLPFAPDMITVAYGTNDWNREWSLDDIQERVAAYLGHLRSFAPDGPIVLITPIYRPDYADLKFGRDLLMWARTIAETARAFANVHIVDGFQMVPHHPENYRNPVHPNELGFMHYAVNLYQEVRGIRSRE